MARGLTEPFTVLLSSRPWPPRPAAAPPRHTRRDRRDPPPLRPATPDEIAATLSYALSYDGRRRAHHADDAMVRITAQHLVEHLGRADFVLMKRPPARAPVVPGGDL